MSPLNVVLLVVFACAGVFEACVARSYENQTARRLARVSSWLFFLAAGLNAGALILDATQ